MPANMVLIGAIAVVIVAVVAVAMIYGSPSVNTTTTTIAGYSTSVSAGSTTIPSQVTFNLTNCQLSVNRIVDQVALVCRYISSMQIDSWHMPAVSFEGPSGNLTDAYGNSASYWSMSNGTMELAMGDVYATPLPGKYTVNFSYQGQNIYSASFTFKRANASVTGAAPSKFTGSSIPNPSGSGEEKYLGTINVSVQNSGDLPTYINMTQVSIAGPSSHDIGDTYRYWIMPHASYTSPTATAYAYPSGSYTISVDLLNYSGSSVAAATFPVQVP